MQFGVPVLERLDIEPQRRELMGQRFEIRCVLLAGAVRQFLDALRDFANQAGGLVVSDQGECALDLFERSRECGERRPFRLIAEIVVQPLLDLGEIRQDLARDLIERGLFFRASGGFHGCRFLGRGERGAAREGAQAGQGVADLGTEALVGHAFAERSGDEQLGRRDFECDHVIEGERILAQPLGESGQPLEQTVEHGPAEPRR